ncbi:msr9075 (plasmid) [Mesorhizobium japonicum MAFF 303099]|uniref:Msr9075 protein n=2 Tax=Mesorhizobium TaxID=68287 RepID=Q982H2_RHILO|nr:msr9075 [Mesorhizobium japonicum MAFF 303099]
MRQVHARVFDISSDSSLISDRIPMKSPKMWRRAGGELELPGHAAPHRVLSHVSIKSSSFYKWADYLKNAAPGKAADFG